MSRTLYDKYGGFAEINRIVLAFYDALLDSDRLGPFFEGVDMPRLIDHQTQLVASLLDGPVHFDLSTLQRSHRHLAITDGDFDEMLRIFGATLTAFGFTSEDAATVLGAFEAQRPLIVRTTA